MGQKKAFVEFEASQETIFQAIMRAIGRSSLSRKQQEEFCCLLDEEMEMDKVNIVALEVKAEENSFIFEEDESNSNVVKSLIFSKE